MVLFIPATTGKLPTENRFLVMIRYVDNRDSCQKNEEGSKDDHPMVMLRYVDNRFLMLVPARSYRTVLAALKSSWKMFRIQWTRLWRRCCQQDSYIQATDTMEDSRRHGSAGSWNLRLSGWRSRAVLISRYSWPPSTRKQQLLVLVFEFFK